MIKSSDRLWVLRATRTASLDDALAALKRTKLCGDGKSDYDSPSSLEILLTWEFFCQLHQGIIDIKLYPLKCTIWWVLMCINIHETITPKSFLCSFVIFSA